MTVEWSELSDYLAGELDAAREAELERELFEEPGSSSVAADFLRVIDGITTIRARHATLSGVLTPAGLEELRAHGKLMELELPAGAVIDAWIPEDTPMVVGILPVPLAGVGHVDVEYLDARGSVYARACDVPVDRDEGRVLIACERHVALREEVTVFRVVAVDGAQRRVLGDHGVRSVPPPT